MKKKTVKKTNKIQEGKSIMTIFEILKTDHRKVSALLKLTDRASEEQSNQRQMLFDKFVEEFALHADCEEKILYPTLETKEKTRELALEAYEEHKIVEHLIKQISDLSPSQEAWGVKLSVVKELIEHHIEGEESEMFKKMRSAFNAEELTELARDFQNEKRARASGKISGGILENSHAPSSRRSESDRPEVRT